MEGNTSNGWNVMPPITTRDTCLARQDKLRKFQLAINMKSIIWSQVHRIHSTGWQH